MQPKLPPSHRPSFTTAVTPNAASSSSPETQGLRRRSVEQPLNASSANANAGSLVARESAPSEPRATKSTRDDQGARDRKFAYKREKFVNSCSDARQKSGDGGRPLKKMEAHMEKTGKMLAFCADIEVPDADAGLKADLLATWVTTIDTVVYEGAERLARSYPRSNIWMDQAAVFSFLICPGNGRGAELPSSIPQSDWLLERRQILQTMPDATSQLNAATPLPEVLSQLTAAYAAPRWDDCMARLQEAPRVDG